MNSPSSRHRRGLGLALLLVALVAGSALAQQPPPAPAVESVPALQAELSDLLAAPRFAHAFWGVKVVSLDSGATLFEHNAEKLFSPASNCKLYTTALALQCLGPDYRLRTSLYATQPPGRSGTLAGDLILYGRGDPTFTAARFGGDLLRALDPLVDALTNAGVRRIKGDLVADETFFQGPPYGSGWDWDDLQAYYGAEISSLTLNDNTLQLTVQPGERAGAPCRLTLSSATSPLTLRNETRSIPAGGKRRLRLYHPLGENIIYVLGQMPLEDPGWSDDVTVHRPAAWFAAAFKQALARRGIKVSGQCRVVDWLDRRADATGRLELGAVESPPLREIVRDILKPSQNLYSDLLLAHLGAMAQATNTTLAAEPSESAGVAELDRFAAEVGIAPGELFLEEGSGLSRNNLATPEATVRLLTFMNRQPVGGIYRDALPLAGVDGTLRNRLKSPPALGNVRAKTGTLRWANSLSGYVTTSAGERLAFAIMLNRYHAPAGARPAREELDEIALRLASLAARSAPARN